MTNAPYWPPPIEPIYDPHQPHRAFLHFPTIPQGDADDLHMHVASRFFVHFAFQLWNASQVHGSYLTRETDIQRRGIWLHADPSSAADLSSQVAELVERYDKARDLDDDYTVNRVAYIVKEARRQIADGPP